MFESGPRLSAAVLAGGKSLRMNGRSKSFLTYENQSFIERILAQLTDFDEVLISVDEKNKYEHLPYPLVIDEVLAIGPLGGLYSCLKQCQNDDLLVLATDMPNIKKELLEFMVEFISSDYDCFVVQSSDKIHPLCGIYKKSMLRVIEQMIAEQNYRLLDLLSRVKVKYIPLTYSCFNDDLVANINTPADLVKLRKPAVFCVSGVKNSGKTTLITKLIKAFKAEGYQVGVIKHDGHEFEIDTPGTDTYQYQQAGSDGIVIYSETKFALIKKWDEVHVEQLMAYLKDLDIIIIEGLKHSRYPKIEVVQENSICDERYLLAVATDGGFKHEKVKTVGRDDVEALIAIIKSEMYLEGAF